MLQQRSKSFERHWRLATSCVEVMVSKCQQDATWKCTKVPWAVPLRTSSLLLHYR